jgi:hypothetical protein
MSTTVSTHVWRPSNARVLYLDSFVPVPRGGSASAPPALSWAVKDPSDVLDYQFDVRAAVVGNEGDSIASLTVGVSPNAPGDLVLNSASVDGTAAVMWFSGGQAGTVYTVTLSISTINGRCVQRSVLLPVLSLSSNAPTITSLTTDAGLTLTDQNGNPVLTA